MLEDYNQELINFNEEDDFNSIGTEDLDETDLYNLAQDLGASGQYEESIENFKELYNPASSITTRVWIEKVAQYLISQGRNIEAIEGYQHALEVHQEDNSNENLDLYKDNYIENQIKQLKQIQKHYKIAVYAICGNEEDNLKDWFDSMWEADYICVLDTGSTDNSYNILKEYQDKNPEKVFISQKTYTPGRFDLPRNDSLKLVPAEADICICTDPDERLVHGGAQKVRNAWHDKCERMYYKYAWSHLSNGQPARVFGYDKIHRNSGEGSGKFPVHEVLYHPEYKHYNLKPYQMVSLESDYIMLHHYQKYKSTRTNYLTLLELRFEENPDDLYSYLYLAHEYINQRYYDKGIDFIINKAIPFFRETSAEPFYGNDLYLFLGRAYQSLKQGDNAVASYKTSINYTSVRRDAYLQLAQLYIDTDKPLEAIHTINECFINTRHYSHGLEEDLSGNFLPGELLTIAYYNIQAFDMAKQCAAFALTFDPNNKRLLYNYDRVCKAYAKN